MKWKWMGVNLIKREVREELEVYGWMYGEMDWKRINEDEVLVKGVYGEKGFGNGVGEGWSKKDLDWVMCG